MKIIGCVFVIVGFYLIGIYYSYIPYFRKDDLLEVKRAILCLASEINYSSSMIEAIINIENKSNNNIRLLFENFRTNLETKRGEELCNLWIDAVEMSSKKTYFNKEDINKLYLVGKVIGCFDRNFSIEGLSMITDYIDSSVNLIIENQARNMRMCQSVWLLSGIGLVIILI